MTRRLYIAHILNSNRPDYRILEKVDTIDGPRDRITNNAFSTEEEARKFVEENSK